MGLSWGIIYFMSACLARLFGRTCFCGKDAPTKSLIGIQNLVRFVIIVHISSWCIRFGESLGMLLFIIFGTSVIYVSMELPCLLPMWLIRLFNLRFLSMFKVAWGFYWGDPRGFFSLEPFSLSCRCVLFLLYLTGLCLWLFYILFGCVLFVLWL